MWTESDRSRNILFYGSSKIFGNLDFARGIFTLYLLSRGLTNTNIGFLQAILFWGTFIFEVPSGIFADKFKRKYSVAIGLFLNSMAALSMLFAHNTFEFSLIFILKGIGYAFQSGAGEALLYDEYNKSLSCDEAQKKIKYLKLSSFIKNTSNISLMTAIALGGIIQKNGWEFVYILNCLSFILAGTLILLVPEDKIVHEEHHTSTLKVAWEFFTRKMNKELILFVLGMSCIESSSGPFFILSQTLLKTYYNLSEGHIGIIVSSSLVLASLGYLVVHKLGHFSLKKLAYILIAILLPFFVWMFFTPSLAVFIATLFVVDVFPTLFFVHSDNYFNEQIPSQVRASFLSFYSFVVSMVNGIIFIVLGYLIDAYKSPTAFGLLSILPFLSLLLFYLYWKKKGKA